MMVMMMLIGSLLFFLFVVLVHVHVHEPFGHTETSGIDDDMNNEHVHFFVFPSFFSCSFGTYLKYQVPPTRYTS